DVVVRRAFEVADLVRGHAKDSGDLAAGVFARFEELRFLGSETDLRPLHPGFENRDLVRVVDALVNLVPRVLDPLVSAGLERLRRAENAARGRPVREEPRSVLLGRNAEADALAVLGDRRQAGDAVE